MGLSLGLLVLTFVLNACGGGGKTSSSPPKGPQTFTLAYSPAPPDNPLKGFMPYQDGTKDFPHSLEWFYLPLRDLQTGPTTFTWGPLDTHLAAIARRGHQGVFRIYLDYPDQPYGLPDFLSAVAKRAYTDHGNGTHATSYSPDYSNPDLQLAITHFITALGARYDNDPRIAFVTIGLLGFWGEWHTYPHDDWMATPTFMSQVLDRFQTAFPHTLVLAREPKTGVSMDRSRLGFHDDSFAYSTLGPTDWHFWPMITAAGLQECWKTRPIGGEVRPEVQACLWSDPSCAPAGQEYLACVEATHASWMLNQGVFDGLTTAQRARAIAGAQRLGYELHVSSATLESTTAGGNLQGTLSLENRGVAPFYYPWPVRLGAMDGTGNLTSWVLAQDLRTLLPGLPASWSFTMKNHHLSAGTYTLVLGIPNPMPGGHPLRFANSAQDQNKEQWLTLGAFVVTP